MKPLLQFLSRKGVKRIARWVVPWVVKKIKRRVRRKPKAKTTNALGRPRKFFKYKKRKDADTSRD